MNIIIPLLICLGSALMVYNIIKYYGFLSHIRKMESVGNTRRTAIFPFILLICFLIGYVIVGIFGKRDIIVALILFGGSIYVSLVLGFLYQIVGQLEQNEQRISALYSELRNNLNDLTKDALSIFRVNLTRDTIDERGGKSLYESDLVAQSYSELIEARRSHLLIDRPEKDSWSFSRDGLLAHFEAGHMTAEEVMFYRTASRKSCFAKLRASLAIQPVTGDIIAFITESLYNDEMVNATLTNKALAEQYDLIAYLVDGRYGVVIGENNKQKSGVIFPASTEGAYADYVHLQLAPVLIGTEEEKAATLAALSAAEVEQHLWDHEPYEVNFSCEIGGETYYKRLDFYTVDAKARFYLLLEADTTDVRREELERNQQLQAALEGARKASAAKSAFLSNMSHDIRTPMNAIIGYTNLAKRDDCSAEQVRDYLDKIDSSNQHLLALINDVLEMSRIENEKVELEPIAMNLREMLNDVQDMFATQMGEKNIAFKVSCEKVRNASVFCDRNRLNRVLLNLLSNAYKFTPEKGSITVTLLQYATIREGFGEYELHVKDTGIGMSAEFASRVFDAFERERTSTVSGIQGTGLGMAITKSIIDLMGGKIEVKTAPGEGTEFIIRLVLPLQETEEEIVDTVAVLPNEDLDSIDLSSIRVLLVEDNPVNRDIASFILKDMGFLLDTAENGKVAVEKVSASAPGYYGLIIMDVQMPVMNGYEATREIRSLSDPTLSQLPIIAMTANAFNEDIREAEEAGMNNHIAKPLDVPIMKKTIKRVLLEA